MNCSFRSLLQRKQADWSKLTVKLHKLHKLRKENRKYKYLYSNIYSI